jgi:hypothetical protein
MECDWSSDVCSSDLVSADAQVDVVAGNVADGKWCAMYSVNNRLTGVLGISMPKLVMPSRAMLSTHTTRDDALTHFANIAAAAAQSPTQ